MDWLPEAAVIAGMFLLRIGVPLGFIFVVAFFLRRLDAKWQAEAWAEWEASQSEGTIAAEAEMLRTGSQPCWSLKGCDESVRANCAAPKHPNIPCWLARRRAEGQLPAECYGCSQFSIRKIA